jgi:hypothetical protein
MPHVGGHSEVSKRHTNLELLLSLRAFDRQHNEQVDVAVGVRASEGMRAKQDHPLGSRPTRGFRARHTSPIPPAPVRPRTW